MSDSVFSRLPEDLIATGNDAGYVFERTQRVATWVDHAPSWNPSLSRHLAARFDVALPEIVETRPADDRATKFVLRLADGQLTECVHMPRDVRNPRVTLCLSSQVGCGMGCTFCATAQMGFVRQLTAAEIVLQALVMLDALGPRQLGLVTIVFMGMGEPLQNLREVMRAVHTLAHPRGLGIAPPRMTISTSGLVPQIDELGREPLRPNLAISLNATDDERRTRLMPVGRTHRLDALRAALLRFPLRPRERVTLEYVLLQGENDTDDDASRLADFALGIPHNVNVIPFNAWQGSPFARADEQRTDAFVQALKVRGVFVTVRRSRGREVSAACGQLVQINARAPRRRAQ